MPPAPIHKNAGTFVDISASDSSGTFRAYVSRPERGNGPALVLLQEIFGVNENMRWNADRYAEEGYVVAVPDLFWRMTPGLDISYDDFQKAMNFGGRLDVDKAVEDILATAKTMLSWPEVTGEKAGVLGFCLGGRLAFVTACRGADLIGCSVSYYGVKSENYLDEASNIKCPIVFHFGGQDSHTPPATVDQIRNAMLSNNIDAEVYVYPEADHAFATPFRPQRYDKSSAEVALQRSLTLLRQALGPRLHLDAKWDRHCEAEFLTKDVKSTLATMVADTPYVNHIPTMTGGTGQEALSAFYSKLFIPQIPDDFQFTPVSRTVGGNRVVDEFVASFTHNVQMDWILPGIKPTGKKVSIPIVAIVKFRGDKVCHEHIYWDQASVLVQVGLLNPKGLPVTGIEATHKLLDETLPSNTLLP